LALSSGHFGTTGISPHFQPNFALISPHHSANKEIGMAKQRFSFPITATVQSQVGAHHYATERIEIGPKIRLIATPTNAVARAEKKLDKALNRNGMARTMMVGDKLVTFGLKF
jgi:hypothetical protein